MESIKTAVIGVGAMGKNHARVYHELNESDLVGVSDVDPKLGKEIANKFETKFYKDYRELIEKEKPEAISVAVPTTLHKEVSTYALKYSNVLVEKPIAENIESANVIIDKAKEYNKILMVGQIERFNPAVISFKNFLEELRPNILSINTIRIGPKPNRPGIDTGVILDLGIHDIDVIRYLTKKEPKGIDAGGVKIFNDTIGEDHAQIWMKFDKFTATSIVNRASYVKDRIMKVIFEEGFAEVDYMRKTAKIFNIDNPTGRELQVKSEEPLKIEIKHFLKCIKEKRRPVIDGEEAKKSLEITLRAIKEMRI